MCTYFILSINKEYKVAEAWSVCESSFCVVCIRGGGIDDPRSTILSILPRFPRFLLILVGGGGSGLTIDMERDQQSTFRMERQSPVVDLWGRGPHRTLLPHYLRAKHGVTTSSLIFLNDHCLMKTMYGTIFVMSWQDLLWLVIFFWIFQNQSAAGNKKRKPYLRLNCRLFSALVCAAWSGAPLLSASASLVCVWNTNDVYVFFRCVWDNWLFCLHTILENFKQVY